MFHHAADFDAFGQGDTEGVDACGQPAEVESGLALKDGHVAASVVKHIHAHYFLVGRHGYDTRGGVGIEGKVVVLGHSIGIVRLIALGTSHAECEVVDVVATVITSVTRSENVAECDVMPCATVCFEIDSAENRGRGGSVVEGKSCMRGVGFLGAEVGAFAVHDAV